MKNCCLDILIPTTRIVRASYIPRFLSMAPLFGYDVRSLRGGGGTPRTPCARLHLPQSCKMRVRVCTARESSDLPRPHIFPFDSHRPSLCLSVLQPHPSLPLPATLEPLYLISKIHHRLGRATIQTTTFTYKHESHTRSPHQAQITREVGQQGIQVSK